MDDLFYVVTLVGHRTDAHVCEPQQEVQASVAGPSDDAKHHGDGGLSDYYSEDEMITDDKLVGQKTRSTKC